MQTIILFKKGASLRLQLLAVFTRNPPCVFILARESAKHKTLAILEEQRCQTAESLTEMKSIHLWVQKHKSIHVKMIFIIHGEQELPSADDVFAHTYKSTGDGQMCTLTHTHTQGTFSYIILLVCEACLFQTN